VPRPVAVGLPATTSIWISHCNTTRTYIQPISAYNVCGGPYIFRFQHSSEVERLITRPTYTCGLNLATPPLTPGETYSVSVRVIQGGVAGDYGSACNITIAGSGSQNVSEIALFKMIENGQMLLYPNPNHGGEVRLSLENMDEGAHNAMIAVYDIYGKLININQFGFEGSELNHVMRFNKSLAAGIYTVHVTIDGNNFAVERMVVN